jgi:hypothetical protein
MAHRSPTINNSTKADNLRIKTMNRLLGKVIVLSISAPGRTTKEIDGILHKVLNIGSVSNVFLLIQSLKNDTKMIFINEDYVSDFILRDKTWGAIRNENTKIKKFDVTKLKSSRIIVDIVAINRKARKAEGILANILPLFNNNKTYWFLRDVNIKDGKSVENVNHMFISQKNIISFELLSNFWDL